jgi:hypothetical protein
MDNSNTNTNIKMLIILERYISLNADVADNSKIDEHPSSKS